VKNAETFIAELLGTTGEKSTPFGDVAQEFKAALKPVMLQPFSKKIYRQQS